MAGRWDPWADKANRPGNGPQHLICPTTSGRWFEQSIRCRGGESMTSSQSLRHKSNCYRVTVRPGQIFGQAPGKRVSRAGERHRFYLDRRAVSDWSESILTASEPRLPVVRARNVLVAGFFVCPLLPCPAVSRS